MSKVWRNENSSTFFIGTQINAGITENSTEVPNKIAKRTAV